MLPFLLLIPIVVAIGFFVISKRVCWREFLVVLGAVVAFNLLGMVLSFVGATYDTELWNGAVTKKQSNKVHCSHSYKCHCYTTQSCSGSGAKRHCHNVEHCQTCYDHPFDVDWDVYTTVGNMSISRVDRQGLIEPPRWTQVRLGEPASTSHMYTNYIKAAPGSVLRMDNQKIFPGLMPNYPSVFDYYRANHLIAIGTSIPNMEQMQEQLGAINGRLGPSKEVNVIFVVVNTPDPSYHYALQKHWLGGKKNDVIVMIGAPNGPSIEWVSVMSWSEVELLKVQLRDAVTEIGTLDRFPEILNTTEQIVYKQFKRKPMEDFAYLRYQYSPSPGIMMILLLLGIIISVGLSIFFVQNDPFDSGLNRYRRY